MERKLFNEFLEKQRIQLETTAPYTPEQNGRSERENRTIVECARMMMEAKSVSKQMLWAEIINTTVYLLNRTPSRREPETTPFEFWTDRKPSVKHFRVFGVNSYMHVPKQLRMKLDAKAKKMILVGY